MKNLQAIKESIDSTKKLQSVVETMKTYASSNINQFQNAAAASMEYRRVLDMSLYVVLFEEEDSLTPEEVADGNVLNIIFGSDHGLAGVFNERISFFASETIPKSRNHKVITVGQQIFQRLRDDFDIYKSFMQPQTIDAISVIVNRLLVEIDELRDKISVEKIILYYNRPQDDSIFREHTERLFPIDLFKIVKNNIKWESGSIPTYFVEKERIISDLIRQYFFITLYRTFCFSLSSENASRLVSMQSAEKNIEERLEELNHEYRRERQNSITEELNDIVSGFKAIGGKRHKV